MFMIEGVSSGRWPKSNREYMAVELVLRFPSACSSYMNASGQATRENRWSDRVWIVARQNQLCTVALRARREGHKHNWAIDAPRPIAILINEIRGLAKMQGFNAPSRQSQYILQTARTGLEPVRTTDWGAKFGIKTCLSREGHMRCLVNVSLVLQCCLLKPSKYETTLL